MDEFPERRKIEAGETRESDPDVAAELRIEEARLEAEKGFESEHYRELREDFKDFFIVNATRYQKEGFLETDELMDILDPSHRDPISACESTITSIEIPRGKLVSEFAEYLKSKRNIDDTAIARDMAKQYINLMFDYYAQ